MHLFVEEAPGHAKRPYSTKKALRVDEQVSLGARIHQLRGKLLSQRELADRAGISIDLVRKLEQGRRHTASIASLQRIARALDVDLSSLLAKPTSMPSSDPNAGVVAIRNALTSVDDLLDEVTGDNEPLNLTEAQRVVKYAWGSYWAGKLELLGSLLPVGLAQLRATARNVSVQQRPEAYELLAQLYQVVRCTMTRIGQPDLAWLAARNAVDAVKLGSDQVLEAMVRSSIAHYLLAQGRYEESRQVALRAAENVEPVGDAPPPNLSAYGHLLLVAASAAGRGERAGEAKQLLTAAMDCAERIGYDRNDYETSFGISQVTMQSVDVHVVTENFTAALDSAERLPRDTRLPIVSRARNLYDQAFAHVRLGHEQRALDSVLTAERMAPDLMRYHTLPRQIVAELLERSRNNRLFDLARRLGVTGSG